MFNQICLIDAKNFLYRNHYTHSELRGPEGEPTSVLYGCLNGLLHLNKRLPDTPLVFCWDGGGETWRHRFLAGHKRQEEPKPKTGTNWVGKQIAESIRFLTKPPVINATKLGERTGGPLGPKGKPAGYKANRVEAEGSPRQEDRNVALSQIPELKRILRVLGIRNYRIHGLEGDDLIGILTSAILKQKMFETVIIHSLDTDFYQLLADDVCILERIGPDGELQCVSSTDVAMKHNVEVKDWTKYRALTGDKSDNIPQLIAKVGPVRALKLLRAGVDASSNFMSQSAINALMDMTKGQLDIDDFRKRLRKNYIACKILSCEQYLAPMMAKEVASKIEHLLVILCREELLREEQGRSEAAYHEFCEWCVQHGMNDLRAKAAEFGGFV
jgi:5'-3' exonuclease